MKTFIPLVIFFALILNSCSSYVFNSELKNKHDVKLSAIVNDFNSNSGFIEVILKNESNQSVYVSYAGGIWCDVRLEITYKNKNIIFYPKNDYNSKVNAFVNIDWTEIKPNESVRKKNILNEFIVNEYVPPEERSILNRNTVFKNADALKLTFVYKVGHYNNDPTEESVIVNLRQNHRSP